MPANTDGNSIVLFRKSDVVSAGAMLDLTAYPVIDADERRQHLRRWWTR